MSDNIMFNFGEKVNIILDLSFINYFTKISLKTHPCIIKGKLKNINTYVVILSSSSNNYSTYITEIRKKIGMPIRHIGLEWGHFSGADNEFTVPVEYLERS